VARTALVNLGIIAVAVGDVTKTLGNAVEVVDAEGRPLWAVRRDSTPINGHGRLRMNG